MKNYGSGYDLATISKLQNLNYGACKMASIYFAKGQIRDKAKGYPSLSYCVPKHSKSFMKECLKAHEIIVSIMDNGTRASVASLDLRKLVLQYVAIDGSEKQEIVKRIIFKSNGEQSQKIISSEALLDMWLEHRLAEGASEAMAVYFKHVRKVLSMFFEQEGVKSTSDLKYEVASKFLKWRACNKFSNGNPTTSAKTIKNDLMALRQIAKLAYKNGYIPNGGIWDDVKIKVIPGVNKRIVEPLSIEMQMELLNKLKNTPHHDIALFLLISGIRVGELETLNSNSIQNGVLALHGECIGNDKPIGGKTASASRTLPICPTMEKLFERGNIFNVSINAFKIILKRNYKGIHAHRLRHSFAVNKLLSQTPLQMVSYQMGHSEIGMTANLYGKFVPEHFKVGFEETIRIRKDFVKWLEQDYFKLS